MRRRSSVTIRSVAPAAAPGGALVALRDEGLQAPLPIATNASAAYADRRAGGSTVEEALDGARKEFDSMFGDKTDRHLAYVLGPDPRFDQLLAEPDVDEGYRFGVLARRLWSPLAFLPHRHQCQCRYRHLQPYHPSYHLSWLSRSMCL